jgi:hypothetical protein
MLISNKERKVEAKIMLKMNCRNVPIVAKKEDVSTKSILKIKTSEDQADNFIAILKKSTSSGPNASLAKGPKDDLLL